ncbi:hypothetical protein [Paenibacillus sp. LHD-38]|uniref:hypothetical protein n=1 Tax=Paenibacillus sp. LHD-38 TaxID=3072143 RepID=UPI00280DD5C7|nr:hypothetical protein [Paenibacillus sp. LHD-38]MDQ8734839.1 hypothetical protein [Paenibacillus sp. LHD-38]
MLFPIVLLPMKMVSEHQAEVTRLIVYRYEDVFFKIIQTSDSTDGDTDLIH